MRFPPGAVPVDDSVLSLADDRGARILARVWWVTPVRFPSGAVPVDDSVLSLADDRGARILARLYLEPEMPGQTIRDPNFYFSADPAAPAALDLLLGTQGWRRFRRVP